MRIKLLTLFIAFYVSSTAVAAESPNVLLITVDDMNWNSVGVYGCALPGVTPNIDRLASQGLRLTHGHITVASCMPSRAAWMTGRYPHRSGALGFDRIRAEVPTLLESLSDAGYFTGILAKVNHVVPSRGDAWDVAIKHRQLGLGRSPELYYLHTKSIIQSAAEAGQPFFIMANSQDPHRPFAGSEQETQFGKLLQAEFPAVESPYHPAEVPVPVCLPDLPDIRKEVAQYFTSVRRADRVVGEVLRALEESGQSDNTLVMFLSDHGMPLPFAKTMCYLNSTRTPWIIRWPGRIAENAVDDSIVVSGIDLAPTILDALKLPALEGADGRSFWPTLRGDSQDGFDYAFTSFNYFKKNVERFPTRAVTGRRFGYIFNAWSDGETRARAEAFTGLTAAAMERAAESDPAIAERFSHLMYRTAEELYDYEADPDALNNLATDPAYAPQLRAYRRRLAEHLSRIDDPQTEAFREFLDTVGD